MAKVAYNACYGGFSLSRAAVLRGREISGDPQWLGATIKGDTYKDGRPVDTDFGHLPVEFPRHDAVLVQVIEELGDAANGSCSRLRIKELPAGTPYRIDEYDGNETIETVSSYEWTVAP